MACGRSLSLLDYSWRRSWCGDGMEDREKHPGGRPLKFPRNEDLQALITAYFADCDSGKTPYTITGLALALNTTRDLLCDYAARPEFSDTIKIAKLRCENYAERLLLAGGPAAGPIFALKNYGWRDQQDINHSGNVTLAISKLDADL